MKQPLVTNIQKYSIHDGTGIRTTVFFRGAHWLVNGAIIRRLRVIKKKFCFMRIGVWIVVSAGRCVRDMRIQSAAKMISMLG